MKKALGNAATSPSIVDVGQGILDVFRILDHDACRPLSTRQKKSVFPLPLPSHPGVSVVASPSLESLMHALNSLHGCPAGRQVTESASRALKSLEKLVSGSVLLREPVAKLDFHEFFTARGVGYAGDEVKLARNVTWAGIEASLPKEVGILDIREFCFGGALDFITDFERYIVPSEVQLIGKTPRTMVQPEHWEEVAAGLVQRGLCEVMLEEDLFHIHQQPLLNGMFAVSKEEVDGPIELLRLIMNLRPLNSNVRPLEGDTAIHYLLCAAWGLCSLTRRRYYVFAVRTWCFFYLFQLPKPLVAVSGVWSSRSTSFISSGSW